MNKKDLIIGEYYVFSNPNWIYDYLELYDGKYYPYISLYKDGQLNKGWRFSDSYFSSF